jgi:pseudouridine kinase
MEEMTEEHLESKADIIKESTIVVLDTNLPEKLIEFIIDRFSSRKEETPRIFLDAVSAGKAPRALSRLGSFDTLKLGCMEASVLSGVDIPGEISSEEQREKLQEAAQGIISTGVRRVIITLGKEGVYSASANKSFFMPVRVLQPVNTSGGGDAFMAGIVYGSLQGWNDQKTLAFALAMGGITVQSRSAVSPEMSLEKVNKEMNL